MKPAPFEYFVPETAEEALALLAEHGSEARLLAGGQSLVPLINMRMAEPAVLIDLNACADLAYLAEDERVLACGPMTRQRTLETSPAIRAGWPLVAEAMPHMGHATIRNRGTAGGSLSHADPAAELPGVVMALDAELVAEGPDGRRTIPAAEFFVGELTTALDGDEMLREIRLPKAGDGTAAAFVEVGSHLGGLAIVGLAAQVERAANGTCTKACLAATGAGDRPLRLAAAEAVLTGEVLAAPVIAAAAEAAAADVDPFDDLHATAHWRRRAVVAMAVRALDGIAAGDGAR